jgi:hypothetical protein
MDNAKEYEALAQVFEADGIEAEFTTIYTPEQNGVAERLNRTIFDMVRAMLEDAKMPLELWAYAARAAAYLRNRVPTETIGNRTPEEAWSGKRPAVGQLRVFGCLAIAHDARPRESSACPRAVKGVFIGYENTTRQYLICDPLEPRIFQAANVEFDEGKSGWRAIAQDARDLLTDGELTLPTSHLQPREKQPSLGDLPLPADNSAGTDEADQSVGAGEAEQEQEPVTDSDELPVNAVAKRSVPRRRRRVEVEPVAERPAVRRSTRERFPNSFYPATQYALRADAVSPIDVLATYDAAVSDPVYGEQWEQAVQEELQSHASRCTWELVPQSSLPSGKKLVGCRWVFKVKYHLNGLPKRFKARLVAQGFRQRPGMDYDETFAPTFQYDSLRVLLALAAVYDLELHQLDVVSAYLAGELDEEVYMRVPSGVHAPGQVCYLQKGIYGLKQWVVSGTKPLLLSSRSWGFARFQVTPASSTTKICVSCLPFTLTISS